MPKPDSKLDRVPPHLWALVVIGLGVVCLVVLIFVGAMLPNPKDNTDPVDGRSGMVLYVDAATGCNYLSTPNRRSLTPRLRADGTLWCDAPQQVR